MAATVINTYTAEEADQFMSWFTGAVGMPMRHHGRYAGVFLRESELPKMHRGKLAALANAACSQVTQIRRDEHGIVEYQLLRPESFDVYHRILDAADKAQRVDIARVLRQVVLGRVASMRRYSPKCDAVSLETARLDIALRIVTHKECDERAKRIAWAITQKISLRRAQGDAAFKNPTSVSQPRAARPNKSFLGLLDRGLKPRR